MFICVWKKGFYSAWNLSFSIAMHICEWMFKVLISLSVSIASYRWFYASIHGAYSCVFYVVTQKYARRTTHFRRRSFTLQSNFYKKNETKRYRSVSDIFDQGLLRAEFISLSEDSGWRNLLFVMRAISGERWTSLLNLFSERMSITFFKLTMSSQSKSHRDGPRSL